MMNKQVLREVYLQKRLTLSEEEYDSRNRGISAQFVRFTSRLTLTSVHTFLPMLKKREVDTWPLIEHLRQRFPDLQLYTSRTLPAAQLEHYPLHKDIRLEENRWGIPEPVGCEPCRPESISMIITPLICFDRAGHRIGYGKGYYDRFLAAYPEALKVGVSLGPPLDKISCTDEHDVRLDHCITPFKVYTFRD